MMMCNSRLTIVLLIALHTFAAVGTSFAQITSYPYVESFEISNGGWTTGGTSSSWAWGIPADAVINAAGHGARVWTTGLSNTYNANERSTLTSPVFDMSSLNGPMVSCMLFREAEPGWDGIGFQFSTDGGASWADFPTSGTNCFRTNWYSHTNITYNDFPANNAGWSGNSTNISGGGCSNGGGPGAWQTITHCLSNLPANLAGQSNVRFRFTFGAGTVCQDDGAAIDLFTVTESPVDADFSANCLGGREVEFEASSTLPGCAATFPGWTFVWNFGDPSSGIDNIGYGWSASHIFTTDGSYTITLTATNPCGNSITVTDVVFVDLFSCLLPISGSSLNAIHADGSVLLEWESHTDTDGMPFVIQRSEDGKHWDQVQWFAVDGSMGQQRGSCIDPEVSSASGKLIYRLGVVTLTGEVRTLSIAEVNTSHATELDFQVWPNPIDAGGEIHISANGFMAANASLLVADLSGRLLFSKECELTDLLSGEASVTAPQSAGMYLITLAIGSQRSTKRLMIR